MAFKKAQNQKKITKENMLLMENALINGDSFKTEPESPAVQEEIKEDQDVEEKKDVRAEAKNTESTERKDVKQEKETPAIPDSETHKNEEVEESINVNTIKELQKLADAFKQKQPAGKTPIRIHENNLEKVKTIRDMLLTSRTNAYIVNRIMELWFDEHKDEIEQLEKIKKCGIKI